MDIKEIAIQCGITFGHPQLEHSSKVCLMNVDQLEQFAQAVITEFVKVRGETMTNEQLSKRVAELYGIDDYKSEWVGETTFRQGYDKKHWLHDDSARCFELMVEHRLDVVNTTHNMILANFGTLQFGREYFKEHNNDKALATRIAILKCLLKMKE